MFTESETARSGQSFWYSLCLYSSIFWGGVNTFLKIKLLCHFLSSLSSLPLTLKSIYLSAWLTIHNIYVYIHICIHTYILCNPCTVVTCMYMVSELTSVYWITNWEPLSWEDYFSCYQCPIIVCNSLSRVEPPRHFSLHVSLAFGIVLVS